MNGRGNSSLDLCVRMEGVEEEDNGVYEDIKEKDELLRKDKEGEMEGEIYNLEE